MVVIVKAFSGDEPTKQAVIVRGSIGKALDAPPMAQTIDRRRKNKDIEECVDSGNQEPEKNAIAGRISPWEREGYARDYEYCDPDR